MAGEAIEQVRGSLDALANSDTELARSIIISDRQIDRLRRDLVRYLKESIRRDPERLDAWLRLIDTARNLERVADHATNIAEAVIYMKEGTIVRHAGRRSGKPERD
jgi:phosphate transport system protein